MPESETVAVAVEVSVFLGSLMATENHVAKMKATERTRITNIEVNTDFFMFAIKLKTIKTATAPITRAVPVRALADNTMKAIKKYSTRFKANLYLF